MRRADAAAEQHVAALLRDVPVNPARVADLVRQRGVLVLSDVTLPPTAPPVAAAAFLIDPAARSPSGPALWPVACAAIRRPRLDA